MEIQDETELHLSHEICALKYVALSVANHDWIIPIDDLPNDIKAIITRRGKSMELFGTSNMAPEVKTGPTSDCTGLAMERALALKTGTYWNLEKGWKHAGPCIKYWFDKKTLLDSFKAKIDEKSIHKMARTGGHVMAGVWAQLSTVNLPTSLFQVPVLATYIALADTTIPLSNASKWMNGTLSTSIGLKATHSFYIGTSIGPTFGFHGLGFTSSKTLIPKSFDIGTLQFSHMKDLVMGAVTGSETPDSLKNGLLQTWEWGVSYSLAYTNKIPIPWSPIKGGWGCGVPSPSTSNTTSNSTSNSTST